MSGLPGTAPEAQETLRVYRQKEEKAGGEGGHGACRPAGTPAELAAGRLSSFAPCESVAWEISAPPPPPAPPAQAFPAKATPLSSGNK